MKFHIETMTGPRPYLWLLLGWLVTSCQPSVGLPGYSDSIDSLIHQVSLAPGFESYQPNFHAEQQLFEFAGPDGPYQDSIWVIMDQDKYVALYFAQEKPYLDVFGTTPDAAPSTLNMPVRHHNATLLGTRLTTSAWYDKWALSGDRHTRSFRGGGDSLSLVESQFWSADGPYGRNATSVHRFTFKVDAYLGYVVEVYCELTTDDSSKREIELLNFMPRDVVNPWPGKQVFTHTVFTPADTTTAYLAYPNNLLAGNLADESKTDWGKGFETRVGGFLGMVGPNQYSPVLTRRGNTRFVHRTCDAWLDVHQKILLPSPGIDGIYRVDAKYTFVHLPPEVSTHLIDKLSLMPHKRKEAVMIALGTREDFENQPLPIDHEGIGLTKGFWEKDFQIDREQAYSGTKSLRVEGRPMGIRRDPKDQFIRYPQVPLQANTTYRLEVMAKTSSDSVEGWIETSTYEWTPHDSVRLTRHMTPVARATQWQHLGIEFETPGFDPFVDVRFIARGEGEVWFDDFFLGPDATRAANTVAK